MITSIEYHNYRVLRQATLKLGRFNLLIGPNGGGKSTVLQSLTHARYPSQKYSELISAGVAKSESVRLVFHIGAPPDDRTIQIEWPPEGGSELSDSGVKTDRMSIGNSLFTP